MMNINEFNKELKNLFPNSKLEVVELKIPEETIDIHGELSTVDFFTFMFFKDAWIKRNLGDWIREDYEKFRVDPRMTKLKKVLKIATTNMMAKKTPNCLDVNYFNPDFYLSEINAGNITPEHVFLMGICIVFNAMVSRYKNILMNKKICSDKTKKYTVVITSEPKDKSLDYISNHPWEGNLEKTVEFNTIEELFEHDVEGLFYQLFENGSGKRLGYGSVNSDYPYMDIQEFEKGYVNENNRRGQLIIISGFSRAGKDAIANGLKEMSDNYAYSISVTTRQPRPGERNEVDYYFVTPECFANIEKSKGFLESAEYCGNHYGTPAAPVVEALENGRDMVLVLETEGAMKIKERIYPDAITFFVAAPAADLKKRMKDSGMSEEDCKKRIAEIQKEISAIPKYDYLIINENGKLEKNIELVHGIIKAQKSKTTENLDAIEHLKKEYC